MNNSVYKNIRAGDSVRKGFLTAQTQINSGAENGILEKSRWLKNFL